MPTPPKGDPLAGSDPLAVRLKVDKGRNVYNVRKVYVLGLTPPTSAAGPFTSLRG